MFGEINKGLCVNLAGLIIHPLVISGAGPSAGFSSGACLSRSEYFPITTGL